MDALFSDSVIPDLPVRLTEKLQPLLPVLAGQCSMPQAASSIQGLVSYLEAACDYHSPMLFLDFLQWSRQIRDGRSLPHSDLFLILKGLEQQIRLKAPDQGMALSLLLQGLRFLAEPDSANPVYLDPQAPHGLLAQQVLHALLKCDITQATRLVDNSLTDGIAIHDLYLRVFQNCLREVGRLWQHNHVSVAQEHYVSAAIQTIMSRLYPRIFQGPRQSRHLLAACVDGELHEIGIRMVADLFELAGWRTSYIGAATPGPDILRMLLDLRPDMLALSVTMSSHLGRVRELIRMVRQQPDLAGLRIMVGGHPLTLDPDLWRRLGADGTAQDAVDAIALADRLLAERP